MNWGRPIRNVRHEKLIYILARIFWAKEMSSVLYYDISIYVVNCDHGVGDSEVLE